MQTTLLCLSAVILFLTGCGNQSNEPSVNGHPLSDWVVVYASTDERMPQHQMAEAAIRELGTNATPHLLWWISEGRPSSSPKITEVNSRRPLAMAAPAAFAILQNEAKSAVPALSGMLTNWQKNVSPYAAYALGRMGTSGVAPLMEALKNPNENVRQCAGEGLILSGTNAMAAIPAVRTAINDSNENVRILATNILNMLERR